MMLPQKHRLKTFRDFKNLFTVGRFVKDGFISLKFSKNRLGVSRFAFIVSNKVSKNAVRRNKIKRRLREIIRVNLLTNIKQGFDIALIANPSIVNEDYNRLKEAVEKLLIKSKLL